MVKRKTPKRKTPKRKSPKSVRKAKPKAVPVLHAVTETMSCEVDANGVPVCTRQTQEIKCTQNKRGVVKCKEI